MKPLAIAVIGSSGRMGREVINLILDSPQFTLTGEINSAVSCFEPLLQRCDVAIDFSHASITDKVIRAAVSTKVPLVIGTTGHDGEFFNRLHHAAQSIPIFFSPNFSRGFFGMKKGTELLYELFPKYSMRIQETHHIHKKDAPSGSAKELLRIIEGKGSIESLRVPDVVGEHVVVFSNGFEEITLSHRCLDRKVFAQGALDAAGFLAKKSAGLYTMESLTERKDANGESQEFCDRKESSPDSDIGTLCY